MPSIIHVLREVEVPSNDVDEEDGDDVQLEEIERQEVADCQRKYINYFVRYDRSRFHYADYTHNYDFRGVPTHLSYVKVRCYPLRMPKTREQDRKIIKAKATVPGSSADFVSQVSQSLARSLAAHIKYSDAYLYE